MATARLHRLQFNIWCRGGSSGAQIRVLHFSRVSSFSRRPPFIGLGVSNSHSTSRVCRLMFLAIS